MGGGLCKRRMMVHTGDIWYIFMLESPVSLLRVRRPFGLSLQLLLRVHFHDIVCQLLLLLLFL